MNGIRLENLKIVMEIFAIINGQKDMNLKKLVPRLHNCFGKFVSNETELLKQNAHEEAITSCLLRYLTEEFSDFPYHIDSQYDRRIVNNKIIKKHIEILENELPEFLDDEIKVKDGRLRKEILPDIIFHDRNSFGHNFLVIEVKKSTNKNRIQREWDYLKLRIMTTRDLNYKYGVFVEFHTGTEFDNKSAYRFEIFADGRVIFRV